jgi:excisionase family DNA binding protein
MSQSEEGADLRRIVRECVREELASPQVDRLLAAREAARLLDMSEVAFRKAYQRGELPGVRIGRRLRFRLSDIMPRGQK